METPLAGTASIHQRGEESKIDATRNDDTFITDGTIIRTEQFYNQRADAGQAALQASVLAPSRTPSSVPAQGFC